MDDQLGKYTYPASPATVRTDERGKVVKTVAKDAPSIREGREHDAQFAAIIESIKAFSCIDDAIKDILARFRARERGAGEFLAKYPEFCGPTSPANIYFICRLAEKTLNARIGPKNLIYNPKRHSYEFVNFGYLYQIPFPGIFKHFSFTRVKLTSNNENRDNKSFPEVVVQKYFEMSRWFNLGAEKGVIISEEPNAQRLEVDQSYFEELMVEAYIQILCDEYLLEAFSIAKEA